jgi:hypothetical protein
MDHNERERLFNKFCENFRNECCGWQIYHSGLIDDMVEYYSAIRSGTKEKPKTPALLEVAGKGNWRERLAASRTIIDIALSMNYWKIIGDLIVLNSMIVDPSNLWNNDYNQYLSTIEESFEALIKVQHIEVASFLSKLIEDKSWHLDTRCKAVESLGRIGDPSAIPVLIYALKDNNPSIQKSAAEALGEIGAMQAVPALVIALNDWDEDVKCNAADSLQKILGKSVSIEQVKQFETKLQQGYDALIRECKHGFKLNKAKTKIIEFKIEAAKRINELTKDKGILLDAKPKPPKRGMYQQARRVRNG